MGVAILTMVVGAIIAITQTDVKRLLAYSSIAHGGFVLTGVVAASVAGLSSSLFYLAVYGFTTIGAFAVVTLVRDQAGEAGHLSSWAGLGKRSPLVAGVFAFFLLAFAGIPLTSGFTGKFAVFQAAIAGGATAAGHRGCDRQRHRRVLLRPGHRADVLQRPGPGRPGVVTVVTPGIFTGAAVGRRRARHAGVRHRRRSRCSAWRTMRPPICSSADLPGRRPFRAGGVSGPAGGIFGTAVAGPGARMARVPGSRLTEAVRDRRDDRRPGARVIAAVPVELTDAALAAEVVDGLAQVETAAR